MCEWHLLKRCREHFVIPAKAFPFSSCVPYENSDDDLDSGIPAQAGIPYLVLCLSHDIRPCVLRARTRLDPGLRRDDERAG